MSDRHPKWVRVEPGHVIPAGQPYRVEFTNSPGCTATELTSTHDYVVGGELRPVFVDSSWKPPLVLPTETTWGIAVYRNSGCHVAHQADRWVLVGGHLIGNAGNTTRVPMSAQVLDFIPLTDEQVARIEQAR